MKAIVCKRYGAPEVLKTLDIPKPTPKHNELCIKVFASAVTNSDIFIRSSKLPFPIIVPFRLMIGIRKPRKPIIGLVFSGMVESTGKKIRHFKPGDQVYGLSGFRLGAYAEYMCLKENDSKKGCLAIKPKNISHEAATSAAYGGLLAFQYLEKGGLQPNQQVMIYGASGTTGTSAIQIAKQAGAHVSAVCSTPNIEMVKKLGATSVYDYTTQHSIPEGIYYDLILDAVGKAKSSKLKEACKKALKKDGKYISIDDGALKLLAQRLNKVTRYVEAGYLKPVLDKVYPLDQIVEAHRYVEQGHKKGGVAIKIH